MTKSHHKGAKEFLLGAFIGGVVGIAAVSLSRSGRKGSGKHLFDSFKGVGKAMVSTCEESHLAEIIDWTAEGILLWNKLKKGS